MSGRSRGSTLLETLIAGAILIFGMVGVIQLFIAGTRQFSIANGRVTGQQVTNAAVGEVMALPFQALPVGVQDGGRVIDGDGRIYTQSRTITAAGDGGVQARRVLIETRWRENMGPAVIERVSQAVIFVSEVPDGG
ncbi:MAG: hypothetical protein JNJ54_27925 [Myxococcaceae bacterium]|nr:hypothetical protein [Myxococcaceae bacterium]